ncbi:MAG TPA: MATE family efflux transporter [Deltaproteobacteria bacterium]|nr:MATE family efflux transporter [Deltaproteobacteria bacterium]
MNLAKIFQEKDIRNFISESWAVSAPMTLIMVFDFLIGITDIYIAGKISKEIQAVYGFVIQIYFVFIIIANALTTGTVSVISRLFSSGDKAELGKAIFSTVVVTTAAGFLFGILGIILTPGLINFVNIPQNLKPLGIPLAQIYAAGLIFHYILINTNGVLRSCKKVRLSLETMAIVCACNICLNFLLVFATPAGYRGIAISTAVSVLAGCMLNLRHTRLLVPSWAMTFAGKCVREIFRIGWPFGLSQALWQLHSMALYLILSSLPRKSVEILAAFSTGIRIESAAFLPAIAFHMANAVIIGNLIGEKRRANAFRAGIVTALMGISIVIVIALLVVMVAPRLASVLSDNPVVVREATTYLYINMLGEPFMALWVILAGALSGAGDTRSMMFIITASTWLVRVPLCYLFVVVLGFEAHAVWWTMNLSQFLAAMLMLRRYMGRKWLVDRGVTEV